MRYNFGLMMLICASVAALSASVQGGTMKIPLVDGWRFIKCDDPAAVTNLTIKTMSDILDRAVKGDVSAAPEFAYAKPEFDDLSWYAVNVPHDWAMEKPMDSNLPYGDGFLDVTGVGWYRIKLRVKSSELRVEGQNVGRRMSNVKGVAIPQNGRVFFECDGAMSYAMLYVNGKFVGGWPYGYTRWRVDLTEHIRGMGNGERGMGNGKQRGMGNGERESM